MNDAAEVKRPAYSLGELARENGSACAKYASVADAASAPPTSTEAAALLAAREHVLHTALEFGREQNRWHARVVEKERHAQRRRARKNA